MRFTKRVISTLIVALLCVTVYGQRVTGKVTDENNIGLPGITIIVKGEERGAVTDIDGNYKIDADTDEILVFSYLGYKTKELKIGVDRNINVQLEPDLDQLEEVVVVGYGEVKRKDLTGSLGSIKVDEIVKAPVVSLDQALGGRLSGVQVTSSQGRLGSPIDIRIRGAGSLTQSNSPLYVIDGFAIEDFDLSSLDQSDIASLEILKGPSAVAIYGARGGNGVVLITSKSGVKGKAEVSYSSFYGVGRISKRIEVLSPYEFVKIRHEANPDSSSKLYGDPSLYLKDDGTSIGGINWQDEVFRDTDLKSHNFSIRGGSEKSKYNLSLSNYEQEGLLNKSGFERNYVKLKIEQNVSKKLKASANVSYAEIQVTGTHTSTNILDPDVIAGNSSSAQFNLLKNIVQGRPTGGLFYSSEELIDLPEDPEELEGGGITNPIVNSNTQERSDERKTLFFNGYVDYKVMKGLNLKITSGIQKIDRRRETFDHVNSAFERRNGFTRGRISVSEKSNVSFSSTLTYDKKFNKHNFKLLLGYDYQEIKEKSVTASGSDFPDPNLGVDNLGAATRPDIPKSNRAPTNTLSSLFYRMNYNYKGKYLLTTTLRYDGSSKFGANNKYGLFPSLSAAWRFSDESFLENSNVISEGKLRMEWGRVGNNRIPTSVSVPVLSSTIYGERNSVRPGVTPIGIANPDIKWEAQEQVNLGLDLGFLKDRIILTVDAYRKKSVDLLLRTPIPSSTGSTSLFKNIGEIQNEGLELSLSTINFKGEFSWDSNINFTFPNNKTIALAEDDILYNSSGWATNDITRDPYSNDFITEVGEPYGLIFGYLDDGLYGAKDFGEDGEPHITVSFGEEEIGHRKYVDVDGNGVIDENDKVVLGNPNPKFFGGFVNNFKFKGFDLSVFLQWSYGNAIYNANRILWTSNLKAHRNFIPEVLNRWKETNTPEQNEAATFRSIEDDSQVLTDRYVEDGSYLRLKTVSIGYSLPDKWMKKIRAQKLRIYFTGQDLITWTSYTGYDPEVSTRGNGLTSGVDFGAYPRSKTLIAGISVTF